MDITHKISLDLQKTGARQVMFAKQGDCLTRIARLLLYNGGTEFTVPSGTIMQIAYAKQDGKGGVYDTMPDGSAACTMSGNVVTAKLHPQMFSVAGIVACELRLLTGSGAQLSTFSWFITVQASAAEGIVSEDYFRFASLDGMRSDVGDLSNLSTSAKDNLVAAINEVLGKIPAGGVTSVAGKTGDVTLGAADIAANVDGIPADNVAVALAYLLGKLPANFVASVNNKTGDVSLDAGDIALHADLSDDLPANSTVQAALEYLRNKLQNVSITPAEGVYVVVENEADAAVMRKIAAKAEELRQGYEIGVGNVAVPIINTEDSPENVSAAHIVRSEAEKDAAAGDVEVPSVGRVGEMIAAQTPTLDGDTIKDAVKAAAVTDLSITRGGGHYTAKWKDAGAQKNAYIVGGVGLAQVSEILSYVSDTGLPKLHKSKLVGAPMYSVMIGDLIVYTGADYIGSVWSAEAGANVEQTIAARNEVFRVVTVTTDGDGNECYLVQRTGLILPDIGVTDVTPEWLAWCDDNGIADADCTEFNVFSFLKTLSPGVYCLTTGFFGQVWSLIYGAYSKHLVAFIEGRVYVEEATAIYDSGKIAYGGKKAKITDIADSVYEDVTSSYEAANTSGTLTPAGYVKSLTKDGRYRIRIGSIGDALFEKMTVDGSKWLFGRSTDGVSVSYTIDRDDTTVLSMSTAGTAKIGDNTVLTDAFIAKPTLADAGKVLTVGAGGNPEWTAVKNVMEVPV